MHRCLKDSYAKQGHDAMRMRVCAGHSSYGVWSFLPVAEVVEIHVPLLTKDDGLEPTHTRTRTHTREREPDATQC